MLACLLPLGRDKASAEAGAAPDSSAVIDLIELARPVMMTDDAGELPGVSRLPRVDLSMDMMVEMESRSC